MRGILCVVTCCQNVSDTEKTIVTYTYRQPRTTKATKHASVATTRYQLGMGPIVNKFEQISSVCHQMSVARGRSPGLMPREKQGVTYQVTYPMMHLMLPNPPPPLNRETPVKTVPSRNFVSKQWKEKGKVSLSLVDTRIPRGGHQLQRRKDNFPEDCMKIKFSKKKTGAGQTRVLKRTDKWNNLDNHHWISKHWRIWGEERASFSVQFFSFSCSFQQKSCQTLNFWPKLRVGHPLPRLGNNGFTTAKAWNNTSSIILV